MEHHESNRDVSVPPQNQSPVVACDTATKQEAGNWFVWAPPPPPSPLAWWNEMTCPVLRRRWAEGVMRGKRGGPWPTGRSIASYMTGGGLQLFVLTHASAINPTFLLYHTWDVISATNLSDTSHLFLLAICLTMCSFTQQAWNYLFFSRQSL